MPERRNPVVRSAAILRKGGAHTKSVSGQRQRQRIHIDDAIDEWYEDSDPGQSHINDHSLLLSTEGKPEKESNGQKQPSEKGQSNDSPDHFYLVINSNKCIHLSLQN